MLLQSQDHVLAPLTALPKDWSKGSYKGLLARGNFEVSAEWSNSHADKLEVLSKSGGMMTLRYPNVSKAIIKTEEGNTVNFVAKNKDEVSIETTKGITYIVTDVPVYIPVQAPSNLKIDKDIEKSHITLSWTDSTNAKSYNVYRAIANAPSYELIASDISNTSFVYKALDEKEVKQITFKVKAVRADGRESDKGATTVWLLP